MTEEIKSIVVDGERTIITLTSSHLNEISLCPMKYSLWDGQLLRPLARNKAFAKGTVLHKMMEVYFTTLIEKREKKRDIGHKEIIELALIN
jgi:hypothetical protein